MFKKIKVVSVATVLCFGITFSVMASDTIRDIRSANLGENYNNSIFENFPSENPSVAPVASTGAAPIAAMHYSREAERIALEAERAIDNKIVTRLELAIQSYHDHISVLTPRRIEFLRDSLRIKSESKLFVMLPNLVREFPDKLYEFAEVLGPDCSIMVLVGTEFEEAQMKNLLNDLPTSVQIVPLNSDSAVTLGVGNMNVKEATLIGIPKDDAFADRLIAQFQKDEIVARKKILPPNAPIFDLIGRSAQFAIILRVAWYAAVSS